MNLVKGRQADQADNATGCFVKLNPSVINYELDETKEVDAFVVPYVVYCAALPQKVKKKKIYY